tara:strand:+ start:7027 stop:10377 length:3351 start_codon:yes stop_codon:yes gene_type:complete
MITMIMLFKITFAAYIPPDLERARQTFYNDAKAYQSVSDNYLQYFTRYRRLRYNDEYLSRVKNLDEYFNKGNQVLLGAVEQFQSKKNENLLLDDELLIRLAQMEFVRANYEAAEKMESSSEIIYPDYSKAVKYAKRLLSSYPESNLVDSAEYLIAYTHEEVGDFQKAEKIYQEFIKKYPYSKFYDEVLWRLSELEFERGEIKKSRKGYLQLSKKVNSKFEFKALYKLGATLYESGFYDWSSKMFLRLYERLEGNYANDSERITLYEETLEYLGLLERKGVDLKLLPEVRAESTKRVVRAFERHGLFKAVSNTIRDYIKENPMSASVPEFYQMWVDFHNSLGEVKVAQAIREEYLDFASTNMKWWRNNSENYEATFLAEDLLEKNLVDSAKYLVKKGDEKSINKAKGYYEKYLLDYGLGRSADPVRLDLARLYFNEGQYARAISTLESIPYVEDYNLSYDSIYYLRTLSYIRASEAKNSYTNEDLLDSVYQYVKWTKNYNQSASLLLNTEELIRTNGSEDYYNHYSKIDYQSINVGSGFIIAAFEKMMKYGKELQVEGLDSTLASRLKLRKYIDIKDHLRQYELQIVNEYIRSGFISDAMKVLEKLPENDESTYLKAYVLNMQNDFATSNLLLQSINNKIIADEINMLQAKNHFRIFDFAKAKEYLQKLSKDFRKDYLESYYLRYKVAVLERHYKTAWRNAVHIYENTQDIAFASEVAEHLHAYNMLNDSWLERFKEVKEVRAFYDGEVCERQNAPCLYKQSLESIAASNIEGLVYSLSGLYDIKAYSAINKVYFELSRNKNLSSFVQNPMFAKFYNDKKIAINLNSPYYYASQVLHAYFNRYNREFLVPWDLALSYLIDWEYTVPNVRVASLLCAEGFIKKCKEEIEKTPNSINHLKYSLIALDSTEASKWLDKLKLKDQAIAYMLGKSDRFIASDDFISQLANVKSLINSNKSSKAFQQGLKLIKNNPKSHYAYIMLMKSALMLKDYPTFDFVLRTMTKNLDDDWSKLTTALLYNEDVNIPNSRYMAKLLNLWRDGRGDLIDKHFPAGIQAISASSIAMLNNTTHEKKIDPSQLFAGTQFMCELSNPKADILIGGAFYKQFLDQHKRNVASQGAR